MKPDRHELCLVPFREQRMGCEFQVKSRKTGGWTVWEDFLLNGWVAIREREREKKPFMWCGSWTQRTLRNVPNRRAVWNSILHYIWSSRSEGGGRSCLNVECIVTASWERDGNWRQHGGSASHHFSSTKPFRLSSNEGTSLSNKLISAVQKG